MKKIYLTYLIKFIISIFVVNLLSEAAFAGSGTQYQKANGANYRATFIINNPIVVITQPSTPTVCYGSNTSLSATATGNDGYIWQKQNGVSWINVSSGNIASGATATLLLTNVTTTEVYRCLFTNCGGINTLATNQITVNPQRPTITMQPVDALDCKNLVVNFFVGATNVDYQWQRKRITDTDYLDLTDAVPTDVSGTITNYLRIDKAGSANNLDGTLYRCKITDKTIPFCTNTTNSASIIVNSFNTNTVTTSPVCLGNSITFTSNIATGASRLNSYQWYKNNISGSIIGANNASFTTIIASTSDNSWGVHGNFRSNDTSPSGVTTAATCLLPQPSSITVKDFPTVPTLTNAVRCGSGAITLSASGATSGQNYK